MVIEEFFAHSETHAVTFYGNRQFSFSAALVAEKGLDSFEYAKIGVDPEHRRIYFSFQATSVPGAVKFYKSGGRRRMIAIGALCSKYDWLDALRSLKEQSDRQFVLVDVDPGDSEVYQKFQYYITVGYCFSSTKNINDKHNYPNEAGVYRLKQNGQVVKIGETGNIAVRLREHVKAYHGKVDAYDYEIVPNAAERKAEQKRLLDAYRASVGRLPELNLINN